MNKNKRCFVRLSFFALLVVMPLSVSAAPRFVFTANYFGSSISTYHVDSETGMLRHYTHTATVKSPSFVVLHPSGRFLYAVSQVTDIIAIYHVDPVSGILTESKESRVNAGVRSAFQLAVSPDGKLLYVPGRFSQNLVVFRIDKNTGSLKRLEKNNFPTHGDRARFIETTPDGRFVYVSNSFADTIAAYQVDSDAELITPVKGMPFATGDAPQASMVHPSGKFLYVANWITADISAYAINAISGALSPLPGKNIKSGIRPFSGSVHPSGKYLYVANWGSGDVSAYLIDQVTGVLSLMPGMPAPTLGGYPVTVQLDAEGRHAYVPNYKTMDMTVFDIALDTGRLINPRLFYSRPGVRRLAIYEGDAPVESSAKWMITTDAKNKMINSYAVSQPDGKLLSRHQLTLDHAPGEIALSSHASLVFVANEKDKRINIFRVTDGGKIEKVNNSSIDLDGIPKGLRVNQLGSHLYVITQAPSQYLAYEIDVKNASLKEIKKVNLPVDSKPVHLASSPTDRLSFVLDGSGNRLFVYRFLYADGPVMSELDSHGSPFSMGKGPTDLVLDLTGRYGLAVNSVDASVTVYKMPGRWGPIKQVEASTIAVGNRPVSITMNPNGRYAYVVDADNGLVHQFKFDARNGKLSTLAKPVSGTGKMGSGNVGELTITPSGRFAFLRYEGQAGLIRFEIDAKTGQLTNAKKLHEKTNFTDLAFTTVIQ